MGRAAAALLLAGEPAPFVTAEVLNVNKGMWTD
jgi:hypothetical protein